jgi:hypothetical protein
LNQPLRVRLTGRAARFLGVLRDFGHIDDARETELYIALAELAGDPNEVVVDLPIVRRVAAAVLFGHGSPEILDDIEEGVLSEDWPLLFS